MFPSFAILKRPIQTGLVVAALLLGRSVSPAQQSAARLLPDTIDDQKLTTLKGSVPMQARPQYDQGAVQNNLAMNRMVLVLKRSAAQEQALQAAIQAMHNPHSSQYHKWLTPDEFGKQYGLADADLAKLVSWLQGNGFQVNRVARGRGTIEFSGTSATVASAFHTQIHSYVVQGKQHYANATAPQIPTSLTPAVAGILSLHNFEKQPTARVLGKLEFDRTQTGSGTTKTKSQLIYKPEFTGGSGTHYVGPGDLWTIYNATPLLTASTPINGSGQTIAITGRSDINQNDLKGFRTSMLPSPYSGTMPFEQVIDGPDPGINDDALEQTLDVEYSTAMAPAAQIKLVVAGSTNTTDGVDLAASYIVDNNLAPVMSTSYGLCEAAMGTENAFYNALWEQAAAQGITSLVSSGDNGAAGCDLVGPSGDENTPYVADEGLQVSGLASTPYNVAVGGNEFSNDSSTYWNSTNSSSPAPFTSALSYVPEKVWNESCSPLDCGNANATIAAGSGGASGCFTPTLDSTGNYILSCSGGYAAPDWQKGVYGLPGDNKRHLPDISLTASGHDGYMVCYQNSCDSSGFYAVGGTSASSPAMAGIMALVNQKTGIRQGQANYTLYRLAATEYGSESEPNTSGVSTCNASNGNGVASSCIFQDVTTGTNAVPCDGGTLNCSSETTGVYGVLTDYAAASGYDSATGLGSVNVTNLVNHWDDVAREATATTLSLGAATSTFGSPLPLTIAVTPQSGTGTPTGTVALITDSTLASALGGGSVTLTNGAFSGTVSTLPGGSYNVSARYAGDSSYTSSTSSSSAITVNPAASSTVLSVSGSNPVTGVAVTSATLPYGSLVTGTVALNGVAGQVAPNGTVTILNGSTPLSTATASADGSASYTTASGLERGTYSWTASYAGNNNYLASTSSAAAFTVGQAATELKLLASTSYVVGAGSVTLTAEVDTATLLANPTGSVTLLLNGTPLSTAALTAYRDPSTGASFARTVFTIASTQLAAGGNRFTATYAGDANYTASSTAVATSIGYSATTPVSTIALATQPTQAQVNEPVLLTATVTTGGIPATSGTVLFYDGVTLVGTAQVPGSGAAAGHNPGDATLKLLLAPGTHNLKAIYQGILAAPTVVTSPMASVTVSGTLASAASISATANATNTANYDLSASVVAYGTQAPTGTVDFSELSVVTDLGSAEVATTGATQSLLSPVYYSAGDPIGAEPGQSVVADFNGDGIPDMATANASFSGGNVSVLLGNGDGTFGTPVTYKVGIFAAFLSTGDFNNDGVTDLAVVNQYADTTFSGGAISILLGKRDGTFQSAINTPVTGYSESLAVADFNRDGVLDVATLEYYPMDFRVFYGNGDGTFQSPVTTTLNTSFGSPYQLVTSDLNGDGAPDIVEINASDSNALVYLNNGDGTVSAASTVTTHNPQAITVGDLNSDGKPDLIVSNYADQTVSVALGNGDGTFQTPVSYTLDGYAASVTISDIDSDGKPDVLVGYFYPAIGIGVLKGNGDGTLNAVKDYSTGQGHGYGVTVADLNGDGTPDVISADINSGDSAKQGIAVLLNVTKATAVLSDVAVAGPATVQEQVLGVYSGDDHYVASSSAGLYVTGSGTQAQPVIHWTPASPWGAGSALGSNVLNATVTGNIAGTFTYTAQAAGGSATVVSSSSTLTAGTYTVTAIFMPVDTTNYASATATRTVVVQAADFAITSSTTALTITAGGSTTATVSLPSLYGFTGTVTLSSGTLPGGFTVTASPSTITAGGASTITIQTTGLGTSTASATPGFTLGQSGLLAACLLAAPFAWRRRRIFVPMLLIAIVGASSLIGCGGTGFANSAVALTTSSSKTASGNSVTLTATVTSKHSNPTGTVTFYNGTTALGTATVSGGKATLSLTNLPVGLNSLTAVYGGDTHNSSATSSALSQLITGQTSVEIVGTSGTEAHSIVLQVTLQ